MSARLPSAAGTGDAAAAETYLRLLAEAELRGRPVMSGPGPHPHRVWLAAATLAAAGAIGPDTAWQTVAEFETAVGLRTRDPLRSALTGIRRPHRAGDPGAGQHGASQHGASQHGASQHGASQHGASQHGAGQHGPRETGDSPTAVEIGATLALPAEREGWYGEFCLLSLARTDSQAALAVAARWAGQTRRAAGPRPRHPPFYQVGAVDDRGVCYRTSLWDMGLEDGREWWDCHLGLDPTPAPGTRWLDVGPGAEGRYVKIDLAAPPGAAEIVTEPVLPVSTAARLLHQVGDDLLGLESAASGGGAELEARVAQVLQDLIGSGTLRADDPAVLQLAGLSWRLGLGLGFGAPIPAAALPPPWASLLANGHSGDGLEAVAPFAADLPGIAGGRFALAGLRSASDGATLHVMARGWEPQGHGWLVHGTGARSDPPDPSLSWQARDFTGRWHLVSGMSRGSASQTKGMIKMYLTPPVHPAATALEVIVTGPGRRVRATVPLRWAAAAHHGPGQPPGAGHLPPATGPGR